MEKGTNKLCIYLYPDHHSKLKSISKRTGQSISSVIRQLIAGAALREMPPADYRAMTTELHAIGVNLNRIAHVANATGRIDRDLFIRTADDIQSQIAAVKLAVLTR